MRETILSVKRLTKSFDGLMALWNMEFDVAKGEVFGVIGPNGAGKTTLFSCIVGSLSPTSGEVHFKGEKINGLPNFKVVEKGIVRTHQIVKPFREMTVEENVQVGARFGRGKRSGAELAEKTDEVLGLTGLSKRKGALAGSLTIGELKKLEIARALATEPEVICLDEVMGGLNPAEIKEAMKLILTLKGRGLTVLMIEHHVHAVMGVSDSLLVLNFGQRIALGRPEAVRNDPAVVAAYLGDAEGA